MTSDDSEFNACPQGKEADLFHERILKGLLDTFAEFSDRYQAIMEKSEPERDEDDRDFLQAYDRVDLELKQLEDPELPYDQKYELAQKTQLVLMDMELLL